MAAKVAVMIGIERKGVLRMPAGRLYDAFLPDLHYQRLYRENRC